MIYFWFIFLLWFIYDIFTIYYDLFIIIILVNQELNN